MRYRRLDDGDLGNIIASRESEAFYEFLMFLPLHLEA